MGIPSTSISQSFTRMDKIMFAIAALNLFFFFFFNSIDYSLLLKVYCVTVFKSILSHWKPINKHAYTWKYEQPIKPIKIKLWIGYSMSHQVNITKRQKRKTWWVLKTMLRNIALKHCVPKSGACLPIRLLCAVNQFDATATPLNWCSWGCSVTAEDLNMWSMSQWEHSNYNIQPVIHSNWQIKSQEPSNNSMIKRTKHVLLAVNILNVFYAKRI